MHGSDTVSKEYSDDSTSRLNPFLHYWVSLFAFAMRHSSVSTWLSVSVTTVVNCRDSCGEYGFYSQTRSLGVVRWDVLVVAMYSMSRYMPRTFLSDSELFVGWHHFSHRSNVLRLCSLSPRGTLPTHVVGSLERSPSQQSTLDCNISQLIGVLHGAFPHGK